MKNYAYFSIALLWAMIYFYLNKNYIYFNYLAFFSPLSFIVFFIFKNINEDEKNIFNS